ncbi:MAG TPA: GMC family oxidoreductase [Trebonia sp.]|nr:GMC family oxidoreductase [Trebonia sp.]
MSGQPGDVRTANRFAADDNDVIVVVGSGAGGGTLAGELCRKGAKVVLLEAGRHYQPEDFINDEWASLGQLAWLDERTTSGSWRIAEDFPNLPAWTCKAVGGTTVHWAGCCPRFKDWEFRIRSEHGPVDGASLLDWPIGLPDLEPYYDKAEYRLGVTRTNGIPPPPASNNFKVMANGARRVGYTGVSTGRMAFNTVPRDGRPATIQDGFNYQGDKQRAHWSTLTAEIPKAELTGRLDLRPESMAVRIEHNRAGLVTGVVYIAADGSERRQRARAVCVAGNAIETARLLLNSASPQFPDGLANSSGQLGRNYMRHVTGAVFATFDKPVRMYRGETMAGIVTDESRNDPGRGFAGGYYLELHSLGPSFLASFLRPRAWGRGFAAVMEQYGHMAGMFLIGEDLPRETNRVTLSRDVHDQFGQPVPHVHVDDHPNDVAMRAHGYAAAESVYQAVRAVAAFRVPPYPASHNLGTARMSALPEDGVVNEFGRAHDIANLFVSDGSVMTTGAAANPTLTIVALALRQADHIEQQMKAGAL